MHTPSRGPCALPAQARCRGHGDVCRRKKRHEGKRPVERRARRPRMPAPRPNEARSRIEGEPCAGIQRRKRTCDEKTGERAEKTDMKPQNEQQLHIAHADGGPPRCTGKRSIEQQRECRRKHGAADARQKAAFPYDGSRRSGPPSRSAKRRGENEHRAPDKNACGDRAARHDAPLDIDGARPCEHA